jgi:hypothetical protein
MIHKKLTLLNILVDKNALYVQKVGFGSPLKRGPDEA